MVPIFIECVLGADTEVDRQLCEVRSRSNCSHRSQYGLGAPLSIRSLASAYDGSKFLWANEISTSNSTLITPEAIISHITRDFTLRQLKGVERNTRPMPFRMHVRRTSTCSRSVLRQSFSTICLTRLRIRHRSTIP